MVTIKVGGGGDVGFGISEGVREEGVGAARGESGDELLNTWRVGGRPCVAANVCPESMFSGEGGELGGDAGS